jgi:hypothetical protein
MQRSEHKQKKKEEAKLFIKKKIEEELKRVKRKGVFNFQPLAIRSLPHSSSSLKCVKGRHIMRKYSLCR